MRKCKCGCGNITNFFRGKYRKFINHHHMKKENHFKWKGGIKKTICLQCKRYFFPKRQGNYKAKYCSQKCFGLSERGRKTWNNSHNYKKCLICKKTFFSSPSANRKTCSIICKNKYFGLFMKKQWSNNEYKERVLKKILKGLCGRPTSLEKQMIFIINKNNLPYKYTGNGEFWIGGKNPDFINTNGEKKLIEVGNFYHHSGDWKIERVKHFLKYGWKSYIFIVKNGKNRDKINENEIISVLSH